MNDYQKYFEVNKQTWNKKVAVHSKSDMYDLERFKKGKTSLMKYELDVLGNAVKGKSFLHLQCHFGQDTLSWARMGAKATGVDLSDKAIQFARELNTELHLDANFVCCNVYDVNEHISEKFDIIFTSYGTIGWLPDLQPWAKMIVSRLKSGGTFFMADFHPIVWMFDYVDGKNVMKYGYNQEEVIYEEYTGTYANEDDKIISKEYGWNHGLGSIITALTSEGLHVDFLKEYDESPYNVFPELIKNENKMFVTKDKLYPLIYTIKATKRTK